MRKDKGVLLGILSALTLCSCSESPLRVSIFIYDQNDTFMRSFAERLGPKVGESFAYDITYADREQSSQTLSVLRALEGGSSALVINLVDRMSASAIIEKAYLSETPLVFVNRKPLSSDFEPEGSSSYIDWVRNNCFYVGTNGIFEGQGQAEIADLYFQEQGGFVGSAFDKNGDGIIQVSILKGEQSHQDAEERSQASISGLQSRGYQVEVVQTIYGNWERERARERAPEIPLDEVELLFSNNDDMALGVIDYLNELEDGNERSLAETYFPIIGVDATEEGREAVSSGMMVGTVVNDAERQSEWVVNILENLLLEEELPSLPDHVTRDGNYFYIEGDLIVD